MPDCCQGGFFQGYTPVVWSMVALDSMGGLLVSLLLKHTTSALKNFGGVHVWHTRLPHACCDTLSWSHPARHAVIPSHKLQHSPAVLLIVPAVLGVRNALSTRRADHT